MTTLLRIQGVFIYFYVVLYAITSIIGLFTALTNPDASTLILSIIFVPIAFLLHLLAQGHFSVARKADNYMKFCKVHGINNEKEQPEEFFKKFKKESK